MKQKLWCCVNDGEYYLSSLYRKKSESIDWCRCDLLWEDLKKKGWKCIKVEVTINEVK